jgi:hypothetical protein
VSISASHILLPSRKNSPPLGNDEPAVRFGQLDHLTDVTVGQIDAIDAIGKLPYDPYPHTDPI